MILYFRVILPATGNLYSGGTDWCLAVFSQILLLLQGLNSDNVSIATFYYFYLFKYIL